MSNLKEYWVVNDIEPIGDIYKIIPLREPRLIGYGCENCTFVSTEKKKENVPEHKCSNSQTLV